MASISIDNSAFDRGTDAILQFFTVEQARGIVAYRGNAAIEGRIEELACKANEGELTAFKHLGREIRNLLG